MTNDIIIPGHLYPDAQPRPTLEDEINRRINLLKAKNSTIAMRVPAQYELNWGTPELKRFSTGETLKARGKIHILERLNLVSTPSESAGSTSTVPQMPMYFPELAGFGEVATGTQNPTNATASTPAVSRDVWGNLVNVLTAAGQAYTTVESSKYQAAAAASQAEISRSQEAIARLQSMAGRTKEAVEDYWPWLLALAGGGALLFFMMKKKGRR